MRRRSVRWGWVVAAVVVSVLAVVYIGGAQSGTCFDAVTPAASRCETRAGVVEVVVAAVAAILFVAYALHRGLRSPR